MAGALDLFRLEGRVAVVTGGAKGIGMSYSQALAEAGACVAVADIDAEAVHATSAQLQEDHPDRILPCVLDVSDRESLRRMVAAIDQRWGRLDILVNNAALFSVLESRDDPWQIPDQEFDQVLAVNVRAVYACTAECLPLMQRNRWGRVINIASGLAFKGSTNLMHYAASKGAVVNLTRSMAQALGESGITVNALAPGNTASPTVVARNPAAAISPPARTLQQRILKRVELPQDLIGALLYLASPASEFMTGQTIVVDGGAYLH